MECLARRAGTVAQAITRLLITRAGSLWSALIGHGWIISWWLGKCRRLMEELPRYAPAAGRDPVSLAMARPRRHGGADDWDAVRTAILSVWLLKPLGTSWRPFCLFSYWIHWVPHSDHFVCLVTKSTAYLVAAILFVCLTTETTRYLIATILFVWIPNCDQKTVRVDPQICLIGYIGLIRTTEKYVAVIFFSLDTWLQSYDCTTDIFFMWVHCITGRVGKLGLLFLIFHVCDQNIWASKGRHYIHLFGYNTSIIR